MHEEKIKALISLISTEDAAGAAVLKQELAVIIRRHPSAFKSVLKINFEGKTPPFVPELLEDIALGKLSEAIKNFSNKINPSMEELALIVSKFKNPLLRKEMMSKQITEICAMLRPLILNSADGYDVAEAMQEIFYNKLNFRVAAVQMREEHVSFEMFMKNKAGSGLMMCCLYCICALRYGIICGIVDQAGKLLVQFVDPVTAQIFYIDPFDKGKILTKRACEEFLATRSIEWTQDFEQPLSSHLILRRAISNMIFVYRKSKDERRLSYLREYLNIINI